MAIAPVIQQHQAPGRSYAHAMDTDNLVDGEYFMIVYSGDELRYFALCDECGQAFDKRDWPMVLHHGAQGQHQRTPTH